MKTKRILSAIMAVVFIISSAISVSAASILDASGVEVGAIVLKAYEDQEFSVSVFTGDESVKIIPLTIPSAGRVTIDAAAIEIPDSVTIDIIKTELADKNSYVDARVHLYDSGDSKKNNININKKGEYYLRITTSEYVSSYTPSRENSATINLNFTPAVVTLTSNKEKLVAGAGSSAYNYHKITVAKDSYVDLELNAADESNYATGFNIKLYNSKKKAYTSSADYISSSGDEKKIGFALKKGTYYVAVATSNELYTVKAMITAVNNTSGRSKEKATTLTKNKAKNGIVSITDNGEQWYKIMVPKNQKVSITMSGNIGFGGIRTTLYSSKKSSYSSASFALSEYKDSAEMVPYTIGIKGEILEKGTYYIKIERSYGMGTGKYSLRWK